MSAQSALERFVPAPTFQVVEDLPTRTFGVVVGLWVDLDGRTTAIEVCGLTRRRSLREVRFAPSATPIVRDPAAPVRAYKDD